MGTIVDNFDAVKKIMQFDSQDDFYHLQIMQRRKDGPYIDAGGTIDTNCTIVKQYIVRSLESFDYIKPEIITLCRTFGARAYINLNRKSLKRATLETLKLVSERIYSDQYVGAHRDFFRAVGRIGTNYQKYWVLDVDNLIDDENDTDAYELAKYINAQEPCDDCEKVWGKICTVHGYHIITKPFNTEGFAEKFPGVEIKKNNPTLLYYEN